MPHIPEPIIDPSLSVSEAHKRRRQVELSRQQQSVVQPVSQILPTLPTGQPQQFGLPSFHNPFLGDRGNPNQVGNAVFQQILQPPSGGFTAPPPQLIGPPPTIQPSTPLPPVIPQPQSSSNDPFRDLVPPGVSGIDPVTGRFFGSSVSESEKRFWRTRFLQEQQAATTQLPTLPPPAPQPAPQPVPQPAPPSQPSPAAVAPEDPLERIRQAIFQNFPGLGNLGFTVPGNAAFGERTQFREFFPQQGLPNLGDVFQAGPDAGSLVGAVGAATGTSVPEQQRLSASITPQTAGGLGPRVTRKRAQGRF